MRVPLGGRTRLQRLPEGVRDPGLIWRLPSPGSQPGKEEIPITLTIKTRGDSGYLGEVEGD